ncbi:uncharacterized protein LOC105262513 [Musca domestica]|uniref:Uncharacterized protein LOC105262513 n=1 Tax=Musca domestica TaxID=7370 RepID=A0ABM3VKD9_MUSDO|nr:uncharacterized protein LOC105262513 [Musca domestica]
MEINVMSKSESELLAIPDIVRAKFATTTSRHCSNRNKNNSNNHSRSTTHKKATTRGVAKRLSGASNCCHHHPDNDDDNGGDDDEFDDDNNCGHKLVRHSRSIPHPPATLVSPHKSQKMKRKRKIPEIPWLIVAICFNCYVIYREASAAIAQPSDATSSITATLSRFSVLSDKNSSISNKLLTSSLSANRSSPFVTQTSTFNVARLKRATHSSPDGRHIDVDVDLDPNDMHGHLQHGHHGDLVDADDLYLHNLDIGYHHDGTGLLPHELPEHDHIAHHLEMQTHEELLEDIRDDTGVNIIPDKGNKKQQQQQW